MAAVLNATELSPRTVIKFAMSYEVKTERTILLFRPCLLPWCQRKLQRRGELAKMQRQEMQDLG